MTLSLLFLFGLILFLILRGNGNYGTALVAALFGFYLAASGAAGPVNAVMTALVNAVQSMSS